MKKSLYCVCFLLLTLVGFAEDKTLFAEAPTDWKPEVIPFPLGFAPGIKLEGVEELRFAPGMFDPDRADFFSYGFVWSVEGVLDLNTSFLTDNLLLYYRGLYEDVSKVEDKNTDAFRVKVAPAKAGFSPQANQSFTGSIFWKEPFKTEKDQTLHMQIDSWHCPKRNKTVVMVLVSPQKDDHPVWVALRGLKILPCDQL